MADPAPGQGANYDPENTQVSNDDIGTLLKRIEELEKTRPQVFQPSGPVKLMTKFSVNPKDYPNPTERLENETKLQEHAFKQNFTLKWSVSRWKYNEDGQDYIQPKFDIELWKWMRDPDTNELTKKQFRVHKAVFFEDPDAAISVANEKGLKIDENVEKDFLDEMRYLRIRDWLFEIFYPPRIQQNPGAREEVIGNRLVPVLEVSSHESVTIPIDKLKA